MANIMVVPAQAYVNIGYPRDYWLITLKAIRAFDTSISHAFQTSQYDFRAFDKVKISDFFNTVELVLKDRSREGWKMVSYSRWSFN